MINTRYCCMTKYDVLCWLVKMFIIIKWQTADKVKVIVVMLYVFVQHYNFLHSSTSQICHSTVQPYKYHCDTETLGDYKNGKTYKLNSLLCDNKWNVETVVKIEEVKSLIHWMQKNNKNKIIKQIQPNVQNEVLIDNFDSDAKIITTRK